MAGSLAAAFGNVWRVLTFRRPSKAISTDWQRHLFLGLVFTALAGVGRYWDNPRADLWQHLGLGSIVYVFALALLLWLLMKPLRPWRWTYRNVLVFVTLTSPPALLYAIPVERFLDLHAAQSANAWFLGAVALWRVALLVWFLQRVSGLSTLATIVGTMLPLTLIVTALTMLNLEHVAFQLMAGIAPEDQTGNDISYLVVMVLAAGSMTAFPVLLALYLWLAYSAYRQPREVIASEGNP